MIDHMARRGADVLYGSVNPPVHVFGHASMEEMKLVLNLVRPRYFMPIHGEFRQLTKHARLAEHLRASGLEDTFVVESGDVLEIHHHGATRESIPPAPSPQPRYNRYNQEREKPPSRAGLHCLGGLPSQHRK
jgi:ribonuclease J